jgi:hypothetical protein
VHHYRLTYDHRSTVHIQDFLLSDHARYPVIHIEFQKRENEMTKKGKQRGKGGDNDRKTRNFDPILGSGSSLTGRGDRRPLNSKLNAADIEVLARESAEREAERSGCALVVSYVQQVRTVLFTEIVTCFFYIAPLPLFSNTLILLFSLRFPLSSHFHFPFYSLLCLSPLHCPLSFLLNSLTPLSPISTALINSGRVDLGSLRCTNFPYCESFITLTERENSILRLRNECLWPISFLTLLTYMSLPLLLSSHHIYIL